MQILHTYTIYSHILPEIHVVRMAGKVGVKGKKTRAGPVGLLDRIRRMPCPVLYSLCSRSFVGVVNDKESSIIQPAEAELIVIRCAGSLSTSHKFNKASGFKFLQIVAGSSYRDSKCFYFCGRKLKLSFSGRFVGRENVQESSTYA